jgi:hypothetical protein
MAMRQSDMREAFLGEFDALFKPLERAGQPEKRADGELVIPVTHRDRRLHIWAREVLVGTPLNLRKQIENMASPRAPKDLRARFDAGKLVPAVIAPHVTEAGHAVCEELGTACFDLAGNFLLDLDDLHIARVGRTRRNLVSAETPLQLSAAKSVRILRLLLDDPSRHWTTIELARAADTSVSWPSKVLRPLAAQEWIVVERGNRGGVRVQAPGAILDAWRAGYRPRLRERMSFISVDDPDRLEPRLVAYLEKNKLPYALTSFAGAAHLVAVGGYADWVTYIEAPLNRLQQIAREFKWMPGDTGGVAIWRPDDAFTITHGARRPGSACIAHPIQIYLDLSADKRRGAEQADMFREQIIGF